MPLALNSEGQTGNQIHHSQPFSSLQPYESHRSRDISLEPSVLYSEDKNEYTRYTRRCLGRAGKRFCLRLLNDRFSRCSFLSASAKPSLKCIYFHSFKKETDIRRAAVQGGFPRCSLGTHSAAGRTEIVITLEGVVGTGWVFFLTSVFCSLWFVKQQVHRKRLFMGNG